MVKPSAMAQCMVATLDPVHSNTGAGLQLGYHTLAVGANGRSNATWSWYRAALAQRR